MEPPQPSLATSIDANKKSSTVEGGNEQLSSSIKARAKIQRKICPARLFWMLHATYGTWRIPANMLRKHRNTTKAVIEALETAANTCDEKRFVYRVLPKRDLDEETDSVVLRVDFFAGKAKFLDVMKLWIPLTPAEDGILYINFFIESSGVCPMVVPLAPLWSTLLAWVPFPDKHQRTRQEVEWLVGNFDKQTMCESELDWQRSDRIF